MPGARLSRSSFVLPSVLTVLAVLALSGCGGADPTEQAAPATTSAAPSEPDVVEPAVISTDPPLGSVDVAPVTPLHVAAGHGTLTDVTVTDPDGAVLPGSLDPSGARWVATADLDYGTTYTVAATAVDAGGTSTAATGSISTVSPRTLTMPTVFPTEDSGTVGVGQPVSITFDEDVTDRAAVERRLRVTTTPAVAGAWSWLSDRTVQYRPEQYWPAGTHVVVDADVYGVDVGGGIRGQASPHVEFDIGAKKVAVVDATELVLRLYVDDQLVRTMPTSLGKSSSPTPTGTYVVMQQSRNYTMRSASYGVPLDAPGGYETPVEYASRLSNSGIFVHGAPWSVRDQGRRNVSHGCLNVSVADAGWFYANFGRGDVVEVVNAGPRLDVGDGFGAWNQSWPEWQAGSALAPPVA
ncbi:L,D-transpeptidase [Blastococcus haudaquaticus]|uniref:Lipoprotein-anchoring transpeptidase ErfK/SrfK n=1 Tax=Blastococcus haudaquaticus TaxID=1938745 RepID=A0A286H6F5_9ACTN|nr:Ig-like domain-containing protein [Blastococcus haudaquaticus]SOE02919.1 Lipoprotein-anchoring transpeptidase ErfK/SrfK [Blastococcus haudaquaticus]